MSIPCERALIGSDNNSLSLINVLYSLRVLASTEEENLPDGAFNAWSVVTVWRREAGDEGKRFQQELRITNPNNEIAARAFVEFDMLKPFHRTIGSLKGFLFTGDGDYTMTILVKEVGQSSDGTVAHTYPIEVTLRHPIPSNQNRS